MKAQKEQGKAKMEFSKKLSIWAIVIATLAMVASYCLAWAEHDTASDVTTTVFSGCIGYLVTYAAKSAAEKHSRNKYGVDGDGVPFKIDPAKDEDVLG